MLWRWLFGTALLGLLLLGGKACSPKTGPGGGEDKNPYLLAGRDWMASGNGAKARKNFERALSVNPESALAHYELGLLNERFDQDYVSAIYHYQQAMRLRPDGYPADNAKVRIEGCKQELVKGENLAPIVQGMVRENERLKRENAELKSQLAALLSKGQRPRPPSSPPPAVPAPTPSPERPTEGNVHIVRQGDTIYRIAREHSLTQKELLLANPELDPRTMPIGYRLRIPSRR